MQKSNGRFIVEPKSNRGLIIGRAFVNIVSALFSFALDPDGFKEHCKSMTDEQREFAKLQFESSLEVLSEHKES